jgi:hypothetical protein
MEDLEEYSESQENYPILFILCNDYLINPTILTCIDLEAFFHNRPQKKMKIEGKKREFIKDEYCSGFFYDENCEKVKLLNAKLLSGVGLWRKKLICFFENPNVNSSSKIPNGKLHEFLVGS